MGVLQFRLSVLLQTRINNLKKNFIELRTEAEKKLCFVLLVSFFLPSLEFVCQIWYKLRNICIKILIITVRAL